MNSEKFKAVEKLWKEFLMINFYFNFIGDKKDGSFLSVN